MSANVVRDCWREVYAQVLRMRPDPSAPATGIDRLAAIERSVASIGVHVRQGGRPDRTELERLAALAMAWLVDQEAQP